MQKKQAKATTGLEKFLRHMAWTVGWGPNGKLLLPAIEKYHRGGQRYLYLQEDKCQGGSVPERKVTRTELGDIESRSLSSQLKSPSGLIMHRKKGLSKPPT